MGGNKEGKATKNWTERFRTFVQENKLLLILEAVFVAFHTFFEGIVNDYILVFYKDFESTNHTIVIFWIIVFFILIDSVIKIYHRYKYSFSSIFHLLFILVVYYCYYRIEQNVWFFKPLYQDVPIYYLDLIQVFVFSRFIIYAFSYSQILLKWLQILFKKAKKYFSKDKEEKSQDNTSKGFLIDKPIGKIKEDSLGRKDFARNIANKLIATESKDSSFAIGINGDWGSGKTSFLTLIEKNLPESNSIIIHFDPWLNQGKDSIIRDFFGVFNEEIKNYINISSPLKEYVELLKEDSGGYFGKYIGIVEGIFFPKKNVKVQYEEINIKIKKLNKKIYIFIDDIDRLSKEEVVEVIKLIRNTANFSNTFFIVAYDKSYVVEAIKSYNDYEPNKFLEKIFQVEFPLPMYEEAKRLRYLFDALSKNIMEKDKGTLELIKTEIFSKKGIHLQQYFYTFRDVNRFINSFLTIYNSFQQKKAKVNIQDLLYLELLRVFFPQNYKSLFIFHKYISIDTEDLFLEARYVVNPPVFIDETTKKLDFERMPDQLMWKLIAKLFPSDSSEIISEYPISKQENLNRYSYFRNTEIDEEENLYSSIIEEKEIKDWVDVQIKNFRIKELLIEKIDGFIPESYEEIRKILIALFYLVRKLQEDKENIVDTYVDNIHTILHRDRSYLKGPEKDDFIELIRSLLTKAHSPYLFEATLLKNILISNTNIELSHKQIDTIKNEYVKNYIKQEEVKKYSLIELIDLCGFAKNDGDKYSSHRKDVWNRKIIQDGYDFLIKNHLEWFLKELLIKYEYNKTTEQDEFSFKVDSKGFHADFLNYLFEGYDKAELSKKYTCFKEYQKLYFLLKDNFSSYQIHKLTKECEPYTIGTTEGVG